MRDEVDHTTMEHQKSEFDGTHGIPIFYDNRMAVAVDSRSPSALKPQLVVADWLERGLSIDIKAFAPATLAEIELAHSASYVRGVMKGTIENSFGNFDLSVAESLRWTNGSFLGAARHVMDSNGFACSPTSGFHHAEYGAGGCFCTFNGLMIAARALMDDHPGLRVGILDMDFHFGDGTQDIIQRLKLQHRVVNHSGWSKHDSADEVLSELPETIDRLGCDVLFYQAGADMHINDPLGGFMTTAQLLERDQIVFEHCATQKLPCVWCLAGGYVVEADGTIPAVLEIHRNTMLACIDVVRSAR